MITTILDIFFGIIGVLVLIGAFIGLLFILAVAGVVIKRRRNGEELPWQCPIRDGECLYPEGDCVDCPIWAKWIERELDDGKQEQRRISGSDSD